jgi:predicted phage terminase large subunit-like protein
VRLSDDSTAANRWHTPEGGGMTTAGAGGALTGRGADLLIIDDPHKNAEEAYSAVHRERTWEWWTTTALTRLEPGAAVIVVGTRWHEDDLIGRILAHEGEAWKVLRFPALAEEADPLGRAPGEALWPERYDVAALDRTRRGVGERAWEGLYQQRPFGDGTSFFKRAWFEARYETIAPGQYRLPDGLTIARDSLGRYATVDLAVSTKTSADWTVVAVFGRLPDGRRLLLDVERARREGPDQVPALERIVAKWGVGTVWIERTAFQLAIVQAASRAGIPVRELTPDKDKVARALPLTVELEAGRLLLPRSAPWLEGLLAELFSFPAGTHDDQVDALAYGVAVKYVGMPGSFDSSLVLRDDPDFEPTEIEKIFADLCPSGPPDGFRESWRHRQVRLWGQRNRGGYW